MRVLIATQHLDIVGGVETYLRAVIPLLVNNGFVIAVLGETAPKANETLGVCPGLQTLITLDKSIAEVLREVIEWRPDVIYCHGLSNARLEAALADRFPTLFFAHTYRGTCISGTKCHKNPGYETCRRTLGPACLASYFPRGCGGKNPLTMLGRYPTERYRMRNLKRYRAVLVASKHMMGEYKRHGVHDERLKLLPLFPPDVVPDPAPPIPRSRSDRVLFIGRLTPMKGLPHLTKAIPVAGTELKRKLTLVVVGDGPSRWADEQSARAEGVAAEFLGWLTPELRNQQMRMADVLAVPSLWPEPFGLVGIEAGCVGLPAIGYGTGGISDWLVPGVSGESAPGERPDPKELAGALVRALHEDQHWHQLRTGCWETAFRFNAQAHLQRLTEFLCQFSCAGPRIPVQG